jgi:hypothetical protein
VTSVWEIIGTWQHLQKKPGTRRLPLPGLVSWRLFGLKQKRACLAWLALASPAEDFFREHLSTARWFSFFFSSGRNGQGLVHVQHVFAFAAFFGFFKEKKLVLVFRTAFSLNIC